MVIHSQEFHLQAQWAYLTTFFSTKEENPLLWECGLQKQEAEVWNPTPVWKTFGCSSYQDVQYIQRSYQRLRKYSLWYNILRLLQFWLLFQIGIKDFIKFSCCKSCKSHMHSFIAHGCCINFKTLFVWGPSYAPEKNTSSNTQRSFSKKLQHDLVTIMLRGFNAKAERQMRLDLSWCKDIHFDWEYADKRWQSVYLMVSLSDKPTLILISIWQGWK